jgi:secondary thiamine-phosphate synthase enzyme
MATYHKSFEIQTPVVPSFEDVTARVRAAIAESGIENGIVVVYSQHTTCSVLIQEDSVDTTYRGTKYVLQDLLNALEKLIPKCAHEGQYLHPGPRCLKHCVEEIDELPEWTLNTDAHVRTCLMGRSESIPIIDGELQLGEFGNIYFADLDSTRARTRTVRVTIVGD